MNGILNLTEDDILFFFLKVLFALTDHVYVSHSDLRTYLTAMFWCLKNRLGPHGMIYGSMERVER